MSQQFWNDRYHQYDLAYGEKPNAFLVEASSRYLTAGQRVLCAGEGEGRNAFWLVKKGLEVWAVDYSSVGLKKAKRQAEKLGFKINFICIDLTQWKWPVEFFDALVIIFLHFSPQWRQSIHRSMIGSLKKNGLIILQCFHIHQLNYSSGGPRNADHLYTLEMIRDDFSSMKFLHTQEGQVELQEGIFHDGQAAVVSAVIQKV